MTRHMPPWVFAGSHASVNGALLRLAGWRDCGAHWECGRNLRTGMHNPTALSASPDVIAFALAATGGWAQESIRPKGFRPCQARKARQGKREASRSARTCGPVEIEHWQIHDHPDHLPDGIDYYSLYRLTTPERVFFFEATHRIKRLPGDAIELDISVYPFDKVGNFVYPLRQSSEFSAAEIAHIRDLIADYLKTDRKALHPIFAPKARVRSVRVRLP